MSTIEFEVCPKCSELVDPGSSALTPSGFQRDVPVCPCGHAMNPVTIIIDDPHALPGPNTEAARARFVRWYRAHLEHS